MKIKNLIKLVFVISVLFAVFSCAGSPDVLQSADTSAVDIDGLQNQPVEKDSGYAADGELPLPEVREGYEEVVFSTDGSEPVRSDDDLKLIVPELPELPELPLGDEKSPEESQLRDVGETVNKNSGSNTNAAASSGNASVPKEKNRDTSSASAGSENSAQQSSRDNSTPQTFNSNDNNVPPGNFSETGITWNSKEEAEITLDGTGWYFEPGKSDDSVIYRTRYSGRGKTVFTFFPERSGAARLLFSRQNGASGKSETKYITIIILQPEIRTMADGNKNQTDENIKTEKAVVPEDSVDNGRKTVFDLSMYDISSKVYVVKKVRDFLSRNEILKAVLLAEYGINILFVSDFNDDLLWLLGQLYEADSEIKDIRRAVYYYDLLAELYPFSSYYEKAKNRAGYLERYHVFFK